MNSGTEQNAIAERTFTVRLSTKQRGERTAQKRCRCAIVVTKVVQEAIPVPELAGTDKRYTGQEVICRNPSGFISRYEHVFIYITEENIKLFFNKYK